ncbi:putative ribosomal protein L7/L12 [Medicago truncatula]|uniref:50S ribosomal protein L7/L12 n=1 Tax=Medicago truncatula TaxID=3880 RepID=G7LD30_MEDTR|nr:50S ribosomal protein L7/L12 [Medicago truncatula]XP_024627708.1 50S ribosomal protein L7/L12 [Medicago truncatula]AET03861.1 50S ribosomal protein L7/L12 [Medicago truncatula]AFK42301.1 unknown [Medicago truncatula]RHN42043.1 putative ribosomal protein L7/L12 [Medicago truncatula]
MKFSRFLQFSHLRKTLIQNPNFLSPQIPKPYIIPPNPKSHLRNYNTDSPNHENVSAIVEELAGLTLIEAMDLVEVMREKKGINELPIMMLMVPGMGIRGMPRGVGGGKGGGGSEKGGEVKKVEEKTAFDVKLDGFDAASKIKVIKEVRSFTSLGLKEAKDLVEKSPTLLKKGVTKEEAEGIIAKLKEVGAKASME